MKVEMLGTEASRVAARETRWIVSDAARNAAIIRHNHSEQWFKVSRDADGYIVDSMDFGDALTFAVMLLESEG